MEDDPLLSIEQVADALECSRRWVDALRHDGRLKHAELRLGRRPFFRRSDVEAIKLAHRGTHQPTKRGALAAKLFRAFRDGRELQDIVTSYEVEPELVRRLYREYMTPLEKGEKVEADRKRRERTELARERDEREQRAHERRLELEQIRSRRPILVVPADAPGRADHREARRAGER